MLEHGDEVIIPEPYYTTYPATFTSSGASIVSIPTTIEDRFQVNVNAIEDAITDKTRALVLNSPNNPTGAVYEAHRIKAIADLCIKHEIWLICDDVYSELLDPNEGFSAACVPEADELVVTVSSLSKSHRMTGWRLGWAIASKKVTEHFYNLNMCMSYGMIPFVQDAGVAALDSSEKIIPTIRHNFNQRRETLYRHLADIPGLNVIPSSAGMFILFDIRQFGLSGLEFCQGLLNQYNVAILPCDGFGGSGVGMVRVSACDSESRLIEACNRIRTYIEKIMSNTLENSQFNWSDPLRLDDQLNEQERLIDQAAKDYAHDKLLPRIIEANRSEHFDPQIMREMGEMGFLGATLPERYGGSEANYVSYGLIAKQIEAIDSGYRSAMSVQSSLVMHPIYAYGSENSKTTLLTQTSLR